MIIEAYGEGYPTRFVKKVNEILKEAGISIPEWVWIYSLPENEWNLTNPLYNSLIAGTDKIGEKPKDVVLRRKLFAIKLISNKKKARVIKKRSKKGKSYVILEIDGKRYELEFRKIPYNYRKIDAYPFNNRVYLVFNGQIYKSHNKVDIPFRDPSKEEAEIESLEIAINREEELEMFNEGLKNTVIKVINRTKEIKKISDVPVCDIYVKKRWKNFIVRTNSYHDVPVEIRYPPHGADEEKIWISPLTLDFEEYMRNKELYDTIKKGSIIWANRRTVGEYTILINRNRIIGVCKKLPRGLVCVHEYKGKVVASVRGYITKVITDHKEFPKKVKEYIIKKYW